MRRFGREPEVLWCIVLLVAVLAFSFTWPLIGAYYEADAYRRLTGKHVTTWDAIWLDLRVQDSPQE